MLDLSFGGLQFFHHPQYEKVAIEIKRHFKDELLDHVLLFSSGTTSRKLKGYALSWEALKNNAAAVNTHFELSANDVWALSLPAYHIGGLSVLVRAKLLGSKVVATGSWDPHGWLALLQKEAVTITTVVPTQVYDLVQRKLRPPPHLRHLIVGGDFLPQALESAAMDLGWPVIRTYGMTEVCSQLASAKAPGMPLEILPIHHVKIDQGRLCVKSASLFTLQFEQDEKLKIIYASELCDEEGYYRTQDHGELTGTILKPLGRLDDQIKVAGRLISILELKDTVSRVALEKDCYGQVELLQEPDERKGKKLVLFKFPGVSTESIEHALRPIKIDEIREVTSFERTDLGKLRR